MLRAVVKIGDGSTLGGGGVGLGLGLGLWIGLGLGVLIGLVKMLKVDSVSDGEGDGSGSDLVNHGALRATRVTTSRKTSWECPRGLDRRCIQQKSNEWRTAETGEHSSFTQRATSAPLS